MAAKHYGLLLSLGGAPDTPHVVAGLPGYYSPTFPHPVGDDYDLSVASAKDAAKTHDCVRVVEVSAGELKDAEEFHRASVAAARNHLAEASRRDGPAHDDLSRTQDEIDATQKEKE